MRLRPEVGDRPYLRDGGGAVVALSAESSTPVFDSDVVGEQRADLVEAPVREERVEPSIGSTRGVLERRARTSLLEPGIRGVQFGHCGVDVFDVEPHLQRDSAFLVEAEQLKHLVLRRARALRRQCQARIEREPGARLARR